MYLYYQVLSPMTLYIIISLKIMELKHAEELVMVLVKKWA